MSGLLINLLGLLSIIGIVWWFILYQPKVKVTVPEETILDIQVKGGVYEPSCIYAHSGQTIHLRFIRFDETPCAESVRFDTLEIGAHLPVGQPCDLILRQLTPGEYRFTCQMGMYQGKLIVE